MGADAIGLVCFAKSPRAIQIEQISEIVEGVGARAKSVALFVNPAESEVNAVLNTECIDLLQFHGDESPEFCDSFGVPFLKAISIKSSEPDQSKIEKYDSAESILLDTFSEKAPGGTGKTFDWKLGRSVVEKSKANIVIAGGLDPSNVAIAVKQIKPFGIDVSSGVEKSHGIKDLQKVEMFIKGARSA